MLMLTFAQVPAAVYLFCKLPSAPMPSLRSMTLFTFSGALLNGIAIVSYGLLLAQKGDIITKWIPVVAVMMPLISLAGGALLLGEVLTARKLCGIAAACFSIYLLSTS
jgi:drug/metabolite transporter (DMT)-like permease